MFYSAQHAETVWKCNAKEALLFSECRKENVTQ